ncbi:myosin-9-like [Mya arenaria]|uniref:myosin-9-like n=1 Tax=Mya arenaria TaxID=6604 RepID=UPI0022E249E8|nr:myosin-9-like [Mya arenaria]XP_052791322.1 myosin-9-like [Mya arenaria]XP_052791324.1 myosin-9-like [Mya arenaria]
MEVARHKPVDRQATFDTEAQTGNLQLPVIDTNADIVLKTKGKDKVVKDYNANTHYNKKQPVSVKDNENVKIKQHSSEKQKERNKKPVTGTQLANSKQESKDSKRPNVSNPTVKTVASTKKENDTKANTRDKDNKLQAQNHNSDSKQTQAIAISKSSSLSKAIEAKLAAKEQEKKGAENGVKSSTANSTTAKTVPTKSNVAVTQRVAKNEPLTSVQKIGKADQTASQKPIKSETDSSKEKYKEGNSRPAENQQAAAKASVLKGINRKRSTSPVKRDPISKKELKVDKDIIVNANTKGKELKSPREVKERESNKHPSGSKSPPKVESSVKNQNSPKKIEKQADQIDIEDSNKPTSLPTTLNSDKKTVGNAKKESPRRSLDNETFHVKVDDSINEKKSDNVKSEVRLSTDSVGSLSESQKQTYVLSPSPTKVGSHYTRTNRVSNPGRLSPSNESVEPIKLDIKPEADRTKMNGRETYEHVYAERNTLLKAEYTYKKRIKQLEDEANGFLRAIEDLTAENRQLRDQLEQLEGGLHVQGKGENLDNEKIARLEQKNAELELKVTSLENANRQDNSAAEIRQLKEQIVELQSDNQKSNDENKRLRRESDENNKIILALEAEKTTLTKNSNASVSEKQNNMHDLNNEQKQTNKALKEYKAKALSMEKKVDALEYENKTLSDSLAQKKNELDEMLGVMRDENKFDNEIKDLKAQVLKLNKEKRELEMVKNKENRLLNEKIQDTKTELDNKTTEYDEMKIKFDQMEKENKKIKSELGPTKREVERLRQEIDRLKAENEQLRKELDETRVKHGNLLSETKSANKDIIEAKNNLETFNKDLQSIVSDKESQISKLIHQLDSMKEDRDNERKALKVEKEKLISESQKVEQYQIENKKLDSDLKHVMEKLDESKLKEKHLNLQLEDRDFKVSSVEQQVFELNVKLDNHSKRMNDLDREKREMEKEKREWDVKKDKIDDIEASNRRLIEENKRLRGQLEMSSSLTADLVKRPTEQPKDEKGIVEAWVNEKIPSNQHALYVQKDNHNRKRVHLVNPDLHKKRQPFSKSSPSKPSRRVDQRKVESKSSKSPSRSLEDLRKASDTRTPESEHSLPELNKDMRLTGGYGTYSGYREIHANRIRAAHKNVY